MATAGNERTAVAWRRGSAATSEVVTGRASARRGKRGRGPRQGPRLALAAVDVDARAAPRHPRPPAPTGVLRHGRLPIRRLWQMVPTLLGVVLLVFLLFKFFGGDPAEILGGQIATPGADRRHPPAARPRPAAVDVQFGIFLKQIVTFDWGRSWATNEEVSHLFATRLPATLTIMMPILVLDSAARDPVRDRASPTCAARSPTARSWSLHGRAVDLVPRLHHRRPVRVRLPARPGSRCRAGATAWDEPRHYVPLPVLLAVAVGARAADAPLPHVLPRRDRPRLRAHRPRQGPAETAILLKHVLRNAMIPILTNIARRAARHLRRLVPDRGLLLDPGLGREILLAVNRSDYPVIQAFTIYLAVSRCSSTS